jgi:RNA polymerase sigma-70 factor (ECF subfamily)
MVQVPVTPPTVMYSATTPSDDQLVGWALDGDKAAFTALVERYKQPVYTLAKRLLGNPSDAEDATQETFIRAYTRLASYRSGSNFRAWLLSIAAHWSIDQLRRQQAVALDLTLPLASDEDGPELLAMRAERRREVRQHLATLPERYRGVVELRYWQGLSYAEVGATLTEPTSTVRMRLFRAHRLLRAAMAQGEGQGA